MGWKLFAIIISPKPDLPVAELLAMLQLPNLQPANPLAFETAIYPKAGQLYIGKVNDALVITDYTLSDSCIKKELSPVEQVLTQAFPNAEICSMVLHSAVNYWGYSIVRNGQKIRARASSSDDGTYLEVGNPLPEEEDLLAKSTTDEAGNRLYNLNGDIYTEDCVGENFVFSIASRYFGTPLDQLDEAGFGTLLEGYSYNIPTAQKAKTPWWKFW